MTTRTSLLFCIAIAVGGCGPAGYLAIVTKDARRAVIEARALGAPQAAPYEWTSAMLYLERSHELAGYARWQESLALGRRAAALARAAAELARKSADPEMIVRCFLFACLTLTACGGPAQVRLDAVRKMAATARERGAYRCSPIALARAEAYAEFARYELAAGELFRAEAQLDLGEAAARYALKHAQGCLTGATPAPPPPLAPPKKLDSDGDGILDKDDKCPTEPEDLDDFEDEDGCPDPDNDKDTVLDKDDKCPNQAGTVAAHGCPDRDGDGVADNEDKCPDEAGVPEEGGCPAPKLIVVRDDKIELKQKVHFATNKSTILPDSTPLLTEIAGALKKRATVKVRIEGHTDSRGSAALNTKLSKARAEAVRQWLVKAGIDAARLTSVGYGPTQPIADNRTASGREENRRVEFFLLSP